MLVGLLGCFNWENSSWKLEGKLVEKDEVQDREDLNVHKLQKLCLCIFLINEVC